MDIKRLEIINKVQNETFRNHLLSHGLGDGSQAAKVIDYIQKHPEMMNSTESRMTMYTSEINPYLYSDNSFIRYSQNDAAFAASGNTKRLNDSAAGPTVTKGRFYALTKAHGDAAPTKSVKIRKNTGHDWEIEYFHTTPDALTSELTSEIPYEARGELLRAHADILNQYVANFTAVEWAQGTVGAAATVDTAQNQSDFYVFTSSSNVRPNAVTNATGNVKKIDKQDMQNVKSALQRQQMGSGMGAMYFLPTVEQYDDIMNIPEFIDFEKTGRESKLINGIVGQLYGINILEPRHRSDWNANILYSYTALNNTSTDLTKIEDTAASADGQVSAGIAWVESQVLRAQGSAIVFPWMNSPLYMGDVYASELRYGAIKKRNDNKGVVMLVENPFGAVQG